MADLVKIDEDGTVHLPREVLGDTPLPARYILVARGDLLTLRKYDETYDREMIYADYPDWLDPTPAQRAAAWRALVADLPQREGPPIPDEALRRENMYD